MNVDGIGVIANVVMVSMSLRWEAVTTWSGPLRSKIDPDEDPAVHLADVWEKQLHNWTVRGTQKERRLAME